MRLFSAKSAPSSRRVTIYLLEKGLDLERVEVNLKAQEQKTPDFPNKNPQIAEAMRESVEHLLGQLEVRISGRDFLAGGNPTIADCTFFALLERAYSGFDYELPHHFPRLRDWYRRFSERQSARVA